jgi:hypothetical protein
MITKIQKFLTFNACIQMQSPDLFSSKKPGSKIGNSIQVRFIFMRSNQSRKSFLIDQEKAFGGRSISGRQSRALYSKAYKFIYLNWRGKSNTKF